MKTKTHWLSSSGLTDHSTVLHKIRDDYEDNQATFRGAVQLLRTYSKCDKQKVYHQCEFSHVSSRSWNLENV